MQRPHGAVRVEVRLERDAREAADGAGRRRAEKSHVGDGADLRRKCAREHFFGESEREAAHEHTGWGADGGGIVREAGRKV